MNLVHRPQGGSSFEFASGEMDAVGALLREMGAVSLQEQATYDILSVGGAELILLNEWDAPCLIAKDAAGEAILERLGEAIAKPVRRSAA